MFKFEFFDFTAPLIEGEGDSSLSENLQNLEIAIAAPQFAIGAESTVSQALANGDDFAGDTSTTGLIEIDGEDVSLRYDVGDDGDWLAFDTNVGEFLSFTLRLDNPEMTLANVGLTIYDSEGASVTSVFQDHTIQFGPSEAGRYYIGVDYLFVAQPEFLLSANTLTDDYSADVNTTAFLEEPGAEIYLSNDSLVLGEQDEDWVAVNLSAYDFVEFTFAGNNVQFGLLDPNGNEIDFVPLDNISGGFLVETAGTYFYFARHLSSDFGRVGGTLSYSIRDPEYPSDASTFGQIEIDGEPTQSQLEEAGDVDWFAVTAEAGDAVRFEVTEQGFTNVQMRLVDADGNNIEGFEFSNYGPNLEFIHEFVDSGTYYLQVREAWDAWSGSYEITATRLNPDIYGPIDEDNYIQGTAFGDSIYARGANNYVEGLHGDDKIYGNIFGEIVSNDLYGNEGDDKIFSGSDANLLDGGLGNDTLILRYGYGYVNGGDGNDFIGVSFTNSNQPVEIHAGADSDIVQLSFSQSSDLYVNLGKGNDRLILREVTDSVSRLFEFLQSVDGGEGESDHIDVYSFNTYFQFDYRSINIESAYIRNRDNARIGEYNQDETKDIYTQYDVNNTKAWSRYVTVLETNSDAPWSRQESIYDDAGGLSETRTLNADGTFVRELTDTALTQNYETRDITYTFEGGDILEIDTLYDYGRRSLVTYDVDNSESSWDLRSQTFDLNDTASWDSVTNYYINLNGGLARTRFVIERDDSYTSDEVYEVVGPDVGSSVRTLTDTADNQSWDSWVFEYNAARQVTESVRTNDDGIVNTLTYDRDGVFDWAQRSVSEDTHDIFNWTTSERLYDASGQTMSLEILYDEGFTVLNEYDLDAAYDWGRKVTRTEADGGITEYYFDDDGALYDTVYI